MNVDPLLTISAIISGFFLFVYISAALSWHRGARKIPDDELPGVSIVVPAYNEEGNIGDTIESLLRLDYPKDRLEIIVVDDGSTDGTYAEAKRYEGPNVRVIRKENGGKSSALNRGIREAKYEIVACMDADSVATPGALRELVYHLVGEDGDAATPVMHVWKPRNLVEKFQWAEYILSNLFRRALDGLNAQYVTPGPFSIFRRDAFERFGGFDEENITEDMEMAMRIQAAGGKVIHVPTAIVYTKVPRSIVALIKQRVRWNLGFVDNAIAYRKRIRERGGDLGYFVMPAIWLGLAIMSLLTYKLVKDLLTQTYVLVQSLLNGGIWAVIHPESWSLNNIALNTAFAWASFNPIYYATLAFTVLTVLMIVYYAKQTGEDKIYWSGIVLFLLFYFVFMAVVWSIILAVKIFGKELRFGGVVWRNSIRNRLAGMST